MYVSLEEDGSLRLGEIGQGQMNLLAGIVNASDPAGDDGAERRVFQKPLDDSDSFEETDAVEFWEEHIAPEIRSRFDDAIAIIQRDVQLAEASELDPEDESEDGDDREELKDILIALDDIEPWYIGLNQARLVLHEKFDLPSGDEDDLDFEDLVKSGKLEAFAQSQFYATLQSHLLGVGYLDPPDRGEGA